MLSELPETLTPQDIANFLRRSRRRVYDLLNLNPKFGGIKNFRVNGPKSPRLVYREDFIEWLDAKERESNKRFAQ